MHIIYCERLSLGGGPEPINALTGLVFILAAGLLLRAFRREPGLGVTNGWDILLLILLVAAIGVGSALLHWYGTQWALLADVIPIALFNDLFTISFFYRVLSARIRVVAVALIGYQLVNAAALLAPLDSSLNGTLGYLPAFVCLTAAALYLASQRHRLAQRFALASAVFGLAMVMRALDLMLCDYFAVGTHFMWHALNGVLLYLMVSGVILHHKRRTEEHEEIEARPWLISRGDGVEIAEKVANDYR